MILGWNQNFIHIPTEQGVTYLMGIKDCFTRERQDYNFSMSYLASDSIRAVEDTVMRTFDIDVLKWLILRTDNCPQYIAKQFRSSMNLMKR